MAKRIPGLGVGQREQGMTQLVETLEALGLTGEITNGGRWACLAGEHCPVYVVETAWGGGYFTWCGLPCESVVEFYPRPDTAIRAGLARARVPTSVGIVTPG